MNWTGRVPNLAEWAFKRMQDKFCNKTINLVKPIHSFKILEDLLNKQEFFLTKKK